MNVDSGQIKAEYPQYEIEQIQIKNEPLDELIQENEQSVEASNDTFNDDEAEKDVDPFHFLKVQVEMKDDDDSDGLEEENFTFSLGSKRKCEICFKEYADLKSIRRHMLRIHDIAPPKGTVVHECPYCSEKFSDKSHRERHMLKHTGIKAHICPKCNKGFGRKEHLTRHLMRVNSNDTFNDDEAEKDVDPFHFLKVQVEMKDDDDSDGLEEENFTFSLGSKRKCEICFKEYADLKSIRRHMLRIHDIAPPKGTVVHECPYCSEKFSDKSHRERHMLKHTGIKAHICPKCNKGFGRKEHLTRHLMRVKCDQVKEKPSETQKEKKPKVSKKKQEIPGKPVVKVENHQSDSDNPVIVHAEDNPPEFPKILKVEHANNEFPQCKICSKKFVHNSHLTVHMKTHKSASILFQCPICKKNLSRKDHLKYHIQRLHGSPKEAKSPKKENTVFGSFECDMCPKKFHQKNLYDRHIAIHKNDTVRKEICDICNHLFLSVTHLRKHKLHKHNIEPQNGCLACVYCGKKFIDNYYLRRHYRTKHRNEPFPQGDAVKILPQNQIEPAPEPTESVQLKREYGSNEEIYEIT
uniref:CSON003557 protein n=1 Tax=Culicoides sonorensis TaxID=179676 RepID=A0A336MZK7_CULSO